MVGLVSYIFGGLGTAFRMAGKIAKWGWLIIPFPYDLTKGALSFVFALFVFFFLSFQLEKLIRRADFTN